MSHSAVGTYQDQLTLLYVAKPERKLCSTCHIIYLSKYTMTVSRESSEFEFLANSSNNEREEETEFVGLFGLFSRVAERTSRTVESVIMVLDPQMKDYIQSTGSLQIIVASDNANKVNAIKNAFHATFGLATIYGLSVQPKNVAVQPVGYAAAKQGANERIESLRTQYAEAQEAGTVIIAIENFLFEVGPDEWVDQGCLVLSDKTREVRLCVYTQPTNVPLDVIQQLQAATEEGYPLSWSGYSSTVGSKMAEKLKVKASDWHEAACGVSRLESLTMAARSLAMSYKLALESKKVKSEDV